MQNNFDPKLYDSINETRKEPRTVTERAVERGNSVDEDTQKRKRFDMDEAPPKKRDAEGKELNEKGLPSALSLAGSKRQKGGNGSSQNPNSQGDPSSTKEPSNIQQPFHIAMMQQETEAQLAPVGTKANQKMMDEMIKLLVNSIQEMKQAGKTDTTLTLQHPTLFAGAKLTVTTFDTAKGEFNITFSELSPEAKQMLDNNLARENLMKTLEEKGYLVHIMITSTQKEEVAITFNKGESSQKEKEDQKQQGGKEEEDQEEK